MVSSNDRETLSKALRDISHACNNIAVSQPALDAKERDRINSELLVSYDSGKFSDNVARLPDEMMTAWLQLTGGHVHAISVLTSRNDTAPSVCALSRTAMENAARTHWIATPTDGVDRVRRTIEINHERLKSMKERSVDNQTIGKWQADLRKVMNQPTYQKVNAKSDQIRASLLKTSARWNTYKSLHSYIHGDPNIAASDHLAYTFAPEKIEGIDLNAAALAGKLLIEAAEAVAQHRSLDNECTDWINDTSNLIEVLDSYIRQQPEQQ